VTAKDTTMTFTTFVFFDMFNAWCCRSDRKSIFQIGFTTNRMLVYAVSASVGCQLLVVYVPFLQDIFRTEALTAGELVRVVAISSSILWLDELWKAWEQGVVHRWSFWMWRFQQRRKLGHYGKVEEMV
jgi:Ca2+-transporting ATPase